MTGQQQLSFLSPPLDSNFELQKAVDSLSGLNETERGAIFTKRPVVEAILDLAGYTTSQPLHELRLLEPSFGGGDFLFAIADRLVHTYRQAGGKVRTMATDLASCVRAVEVHQTTFRSTFEKLSAHLQQIGLTTPDAEALTKTWLRQDDFLLTAIDEKFDFVVGNPPYVRQERIAPVLLAEYKKRYKTIYDRADLYVPFIERSLDLLNTNGKLGFICANRWVKNKYGKKLRKKVASGGFSLDHYIDMEGTNAFDSEVIAYPSVFVIRRGPTRPTRLARKPSIDFKTLSQLTTEMCAEGCQNSPTVETVHSVASGQDPWLLEDAEQLLLIRKLEHAFPTIEEDGSTIGIGVATGCDRVFIGPYDELPVEPERKLRLVKAPDIDAGTVSWSGLGVINPFLDSGALASMEEFPAFGAYIEQHRSAISARHVAKKNPERWYRTIDRIYPHKLQTPKLLIPDIKGGATVAYDPGEFYPHHNLYCITSAQWDLRALQAVLRSSVALMFVAAYSVRMSGGFLRFQAQYLRRIRIPSWSSISTKDKANLVRLAESTNQNAIDAAVFKLYGLTPAEASVATQLADAARVRRNRGAAAK